MRTTPDKAAPLGNFEVNIASSVTEKVKLMSNFKSNVSKPCRREKNQDSESLNATFWVSGKGHTSSTAGVRGRWKRSCDT